MMRCRILIGLLLLSAVCVQPAWGIIVFLKGEEKPVRGYLVSQTPQFIEIRALQAGGKLVTRRIARSSIDDLLISVLPDRLEKLDPADPDGYRDYAEELAEKWRDPEARETALRLFLIAAYLAPDRLGHSCLLAMIPLADGELQQRRFRAMAYLLDPAHDTSVLQTGHATRRPATSLDPKLAEALIRALRLLRQGKRRDAQTQAHRFHLADHLAELTDQITVEEFENACQSKCPHCKFGYVTCSLCKGKRWIERDGQRVVCPDCHGKGRVVCPYCKGKYQNVPIPPGLVRRIIQLELAWMPEPAKAKASERTEAAVPNWSRVLVSSHFRPVRPLTLETLTDIDPRACRYRNGKWVQADSDRASRADR